ncbi:MAG: mandelate racemase [Alphaproteobacteria bacterium]|nr:MAG: mandelate racemase [Alphaproteobacteria bacterium]
MIALLSVALSRIPLKARMPFRYGIATMTEVTHVFLRLEFDFDGKVQSGLAADHLPPKWFTKDPSRPLDEEVAEMLAVIRAAVGHARAIRAATPFLFWRELYAAQSTWAKANKIPPLLAHFGTSLVERALLDAFCRVRGVTLAAALRGNLVEMDLGALHTVLAGTTPRDWLPAQPPAEVFARHTVGLSDPITDDEIPADERVTDGLPQSLVACIRFYGLTHFKLKINGDAPRDRARLARMAEVFARECPAGYGYSLDGNESFREVGAFADYVRGLRAGVGDAAFWSHLLFIEQPWHRDVALTPAIGELARAWPDRPPIIIDESDAELTSLPTALGLGYAGTSHKNCKGIFKSVANACLLAQRRTAGLPAMLSGEDLSNVGPVALLQDLAAAATLGVTSIERNGHHYFAGLSQFPATVRAHILQHHADLYTRSEAGWPRLDVKNGRLHLASVLDAPFGIAGDLDLSALQTEKL